jgi:hypothetical protein
MLRLPLTDQMQKEGSGTRKLRRKIIEAAFTLSRKEEGGWRFASPFFG